MPAVRRTESVLPPSGGQLSRRAVLLGAAGTVGVGLLAACSGSNDVSSGSTTAPTGATSTSEAATGAGTPVLIATFDPRSLAVAGIENRLPFALGGEDGVPTKDGPAQLDFLISTSAGQPVGDPITVDRHADGTPIGYYPVRFTPPQAGAYVARTVVDGTKAEQAFQVNATSTTDLLQPGSPMRSIATPTLDDTLGTDPICTQKPEPCALHSLNLTDALAAGKPTAVLFSTPAFCQTGVCGPVLALLLEQVAAFPDVQFIHCEIYKGDPTAGSAELVEAVEGYGLTYEPSLFVADAAGTVVSRLDNVFDRVEMATALEQASA